MAGGTADEPAESQGDKDGGEAEVREKAARSAARQKAARGEAEAPGGADRTAGVGAAPVDGDSAAAARAGSRGRRPDGNGTPVRRVPSRRGLLAVSAVAGLGALTGCGASPSSPPGGPASGKSPGSGKDAGKPDGKGGGAGGSRGTEGSGNQGAGGSQSRSPSPGRTRTRPELPRGGRELFPRYRLVGYCGLPGAPALGKLGDGDPGKRVSELERTAKEYTGGREPLPVLELLAAVANPAAGPDGTYRTRIPGKTIRRFHELARERDALLLLNIQPGRAAMLEEVEALGEWLRHPDVGVALDPEWDMGPGEVPGETYGRTDAGELNDVADYLAKLVDKHDLPQKPLVFHQVAPSVVGDEQKLRPAEGVTLIKSADGIGSPELKRATWRRLVDDMPDGLHTGFKLFYQEDAEGSRLMKPTEVLKLRPEPEYVMYE